MFENLMEQQNTCKDQILEIIQSLFTEIESLKNENETLKAKLEASSTACSDSDLDSDDDCSDPDFRRYLETKNASIMSKFLFY